MTFTAPTTKPLPGEVLRSPAAEPSPYSILSQPRPLPVPPNINRRKDGLPAAGLRLDHQRCIQAVKLPNCDPEDADDYPSPAEDEGPRFYPVTWTVPVGCKGGVVPPEYEQWALEDVEAVTAYQLESFLWGDASLETVQGPGTFMPSLMSVAQVVGDPDQPVNPRDGLAQVLADYLRCNEAGGKATAYIPHIFGEYLIGNQSLVASGTQLKTATGHNAVLGTGFDRNRSPFNNASPSALDNAADGTGWIVVGGPVYWDLGSPYITADPWGRLRAASRTRSLTGVSHMPSGSQVVVGARSAHFAFDPCCVRAIKVRVVNVPGEAG